MTTQVSIESLTSYDWVNEVKDSKSPADIVAMTELDYSEGVQQLKLCFSDGSSVVQSRRWRDEATHSNWVDMQSNNYELSMSMVERESFLLKETVCEPMKTGTDLDNFIRDIYHKDCFAEPTPALEAFFTEDEVRVAGQQWLKDNNLTVDQNNRLVPAVTPKDIEDLSLEFLKIDINLKGYMVEVKSKFQQVTSAFRAYSANAVRVKNFSYDAIKVRKTVASLQRVPYSVLVDLGIYCVPGQAVNYLGLLEVLERSGNASVESIDKDLKSFIAAVGYLVNNPQALSSARKTLGTPLVNLEPVKKQLSACFNTTNVTTLPYSQLVDRNDDWAEIKTRVDRLLDLYDGCAPKYVKELVDSVVNNLDNIYRSSMNGEEIATKQNLEVLSQWCFHCAELVEFYAAYTNVLRTLLVALNDSVEKISRVAKHY